MLILWSSLPDLFERSNQQNIKTIRGVILEKFFEYVRVFGLRATIEIAAQKILCYKIYRIHIKGLSNSIAFRVGTDDLTVLRQLFGDNELNISLENEPRTILDAGGNVGYAALYFHRRYPWAQIYSIEPESSNIEIFKMNCAKYDQIHLIEGGLWPRSTYLKISNPDSRKDGFRVEEYKEYIDHGIKAYTVNQILNMFNIEQVDLLKVDIEGAEKELFSENVDQWLPQVKVVMIELHDRFKPGCKESVYNALSSRTTRTDIIGEYEVFHIEY